MKIDGIEIVQATLEDIPGIIEVEKSAWGIDGAATEYLFESRIKIFPEGVIVAKERSGKVIGVVAVCICDYEEDMITNPNKKALNWFEATGYGTFQGVHDPNGLVIYGTDLSVDRYWTRRGVGQELIICALKKFSSPPFTKKMGLIGARIPGYAAYSSSMSADQYVKATKGEGEPLDDELNFFLAIECYGVHWEIARTIPEYFPDPPSKNFAALLVWRNPFFNSGNK